MSDISLFDGFCRIGKSRVKRRGEISGAEQLLGEMDYFGIEEALVHHVVAVENHPRLGNELLMKELKGYGRLNPCWVLLPAATEELAPASELVAQMLEQGVRAARLCPSPEGAGVHHGYGMSQRVCGPLLAVLEAHRIPLFIDLARLTWLQVDEICSTYPELPLVVTDVGYRINRELYPRLESYENLYIELSRYEVHNGLEDISARFGVHHLIFGGGMPVYTPGATIAMVACADISQEEKALIGGGNLRNLLKAVR